MKVTPPGIMVSNIWPTAGGTLAGILMTMPFLTSAMYRREAVMPVRIARKMPLAPREVSGITFRALAMIVSPLSVTTCAWPENGVRIIKEPRAMIAGAKGFMSKERATSYPMASTTNTAIKSDVTETGMDSRFPMPLLVRNVWYGAIGSDLNSVKMEPAMESAAMLMNPFVMTFT